MQRISQAIQIYEPTIQMGVKGPHIVHGLFNILYDVKHVLEGGVPSSSGTLDPTPEDQFMLDRDFQ